MFYRFDIYPKTVWINEANFCTERPELAHSLYSKTVENIKERNSNQPIHILKLHVLIYVSKIVQHRPSHAW